MGAIGKIVAKSKRPRRGPVKRTAPLQPSYRTGKQTQESIVTAAETVLVRYGHAGFTLKRVADCAGIAVGNLSYHFPTKESLLELLINQTLAEYANRFSTLIPRQPASRAATVGELVAWFMDDSVTASLHALVSRALGGGSAQSVSQCRSRAFL